MKINFKLFKLKKFYCRLKLFLYWWFNIWISKLSRKKPGTN